MSYRIPFFPSLKGEREGKKDWHSCSSQLAPSRHLGPSEFELMKVIGIGAFGKVLMVRVRKNRQVYAMKFISKKMVHKRNNVASMKAERDIMARIDHPFLVSLKCAFQTDSKLFLVMEFLAGGELFFHLSKQGLLKEDTAQFYMAEIVLALEHLHSLGIIHRDLKPENLLLGSDGHVRLTAFGLAKEVEEGNDDGWRLRTICGTSEYMAPEMILKKGYGKAVDWWSLGTLLFEMITGYAPFRAHSTRDLYRKILNDKISLPTWVSAPCHQIMRGLLERNVNKRLGATKSTMFEVGGVKVLKNHPFFVDIDWKDLLSKSIPPPFMPNLSGGPMDTSNFCPDFLNMAIPRSLGEDSIASSTTTSGTCGDGERSIACDTSRRGTVPIDDRGQKDIFRGFSYVVDDFGSINDIIDNDQQPVESGNGNVDECNLTINNKAAASLQLANGFHVMDGLSVVDNRNNKVAGRLKAKGKRNRKNRDKKQQQKDTKIINGGKREEEDDSSLSVAVNGAKPIAKLATTEPTALMPSLKRSGSSLADLLERQQLLANSKMAEEDVMTQVSGGSGRAPPPPLCRHTTRIPSRKPSSPSVTGDDDKICVRVDDNRSTDGAQTHSWASMFVASQGKGFSSGRRVVESQHFPKGEAQANHRPPIPCPQPSIVQGSSKLSVPCTKSAIPAENEWHVVGAKGKIAHTNSLMTPHDLRSSQPTITSESCTNSAAASMENEWQVVGTKGRTKCKNSIK